MISELYIHTTMKNKTTQRSAGFASHYFLPKPEVFDKNILHNLFILAPLQPSHPQCGVFYWKFSALRFICFCLLSVLGSCDPRPHLILVDIFLFFDLWTTIK